MLIISTLQLLSSSAVTLRRDKSILYSRVSITIFNYSALLAYTSLYLTSLDRGIGLYGGLFHATSITHVFQIFLFFLGALILQLTAFHPHQVFTPEFSSLITKFDILSKYSTRFINKRGEQFKIIEYPLILLFVVSGATFLVSTSDLVSIFLSIELQSYGLYILSTLYRNSELATTGGLTYFLLGGLSSCFILLGTSLLYANSGTTNLDGIYVITSLSDLANEGGSSNILYWYKSHYINFSLLILSVGFLFKVSAAPFHFWSPGVYDAIPTIVTTFVAIVAKISIFIFLLELVHYTSNSLFNFEFTWTNSLLVSSLLSLITGAVVGLTQSRIKRLFAYSTISHLGFILLALSINSIESIQAFIFYLMQYSVSNLNAFIILISIGYSFNDNINSDEYPLLDDKINSPVQLLSQLKGFFMINPVLALSFTITIFSFAGIPPLIGFFAKQTVLSAALDSGYIFLALVAILTSVISGVYYLNIIKEIYFEKLVHDMGYVTKYNSLFNVRSHLMGDVFENKILSKITSYLMGDVFKNKILSKITSQDIEDLANKIKSKLRAQKMEFITYKMRFLTNKKLRNVLDQYMEDVIRKSVLDKMRLDQRNKSIKTIIFKPDNVILSSSLTITIGVLTLIILLFLFFPKQIFASAVLLTLFIQ